MTTVIYSLTDGRVLRSVSCPPEYSETQLLTSDEAFILTDGVDEEGQYVVEGVLKDRPKALVTYTAGVLQGLPAECQITVNGAEEPSAPELDLRTRGAGTYNVRVIAFPHRDFEVTIEVPKSPEEHRQDKLETAKVERDRRIDGGCAVAGIGRFDTDAVSRGYLLGAGSLASLALQNSEPFLEEWTLADNSVVALDAAQVQMIGVAVAAHVSACHARYRGLKQEIADAEDPTSVDVLTGWPG